MEGIVDDAVVQRVAGELDLAIPIVYTKHGNTRLRTKVVGYNNAARRAPWFVLTDLDPGYACPSELCQDWLAAPAAPMMRFRVAVRAVEAWFMADRERFASFLRIARAKLPTDPESVLDPKGLVVDLVRHHSRSTAIQQDIVPSSGSRRRTGPAYASRMIEFVSNAWDPRAAAGRSPSLARCLERVGDLATP